MSGEPRNRRTSLLSGPYAALGLTAGIAMLGFLLLPLVALVTTLSWSDFISGIGHPAVQPALKLSLITTLICLAIVVLLGTPLAWTLSRSTGRWVGWVETLMRLPAVLPPAVAGVALLLAFGRRGLLGPWLESMGISIPFTTTAVVVAEVFVAAPFFLQSALSAFREVDEDQLVVARTLGAGPGEVFVRVALPLAAPGLISGAAMAWARALGEFGATLMFAGSLPGKTQTLTLAIYTTFESDMRAAQSISVVLVVVAFGLLLALTTRRKKDVVETRPEPEETVDAAPVAMDLRGAGELTVDLQARTGSFELSVRLPQYGGTTVVVGPNGAGKSTLLKCLLGIAVPNEGAITLADRVLFSASKGVDVPPEGRRLGYVPQRYALFSAMTVEDNVGFGLRRMAKAERSQRVRKLLEQLNISHLASRRTTELSGGEAQRVALARALAIDPDALLLDEPMAALDVTARGQVREVLAQWLKVLRLPTVVVTHDVEDIDALGDRVAVLERGKIVQLGTPAEVRADPRSAFVRRFLRAEVDE